MSSSFNGDRYLILARYSNQMISCPLLIWGFWFLKDEQGTVSNTQRETKETTKSPTGQYGIHATAYLLMHV